MKWQCSFISLLAICIGVSHQRPSPDPMKYRAAVVEYSPKYLGSADATLRANTDAYVKLIQEAAAQDVDIIVFPEDGLTSFGVPLRDKLVPWSTLIPPASLNYTPCTNNTIRVSKTMKRLSCAARENQIYVVVNLIERKPCRGKKDCPKDGTFFYNSNVVFDRNGTIIARYRKTNLIGEMIFDVTKEPEVVTFDTDFGVKFGTFICFDIFYQDPAIILTRSVGVRDIVYPTAWFSETPFLTAPQIQSGWSFAEDVNLLASGYHNPQRTNGGSGIYLGKGGIANATMPLNNTCPQLIIADVMKKGERFELEPPHKRQRPVPPPPPFSVMMANMGGNHRLHTYNLSLMSDPNLRSATSKRITQDSVKTTLCKNNFCCKFNVEMLRRDPKVTYRLVVLDGTRNFQGARFVGIQACGVVQCSNSSIASCGSVTNTKAVFDQISIEANFDDSRNRWIIPTTLNTSVFPLGNWDIQENGCNNNVNVKLSTNSITKDLATFGLFSRYFARDDVNQPK